MRILIAIFIVSLLTVLDSLAQPHSILKSFIAFQQEDAIVLRWTISGGNQCAGTTMFRSGDNDVFNQIGHIEGICGSTDSDETYQFVDSTATANVNNFYKLEMGQQGFTSVVQIFFEQFGEDNVLVEPNYTDGPLRILFSNPEKDVTALRLVDNSGREVLRESASGSEFNLSLENLKTGIYYFQLSKDGEVKTGKFYKL